VPEAGVERTLRQFRAVLIFSGLFNIVLAFPLMLPELYAHYFALLWKVNVLVGLGGQAPIPPTEGVAALLINTAGIDLVLIGAIVLYAARDPLARWFIPAINAVARTVFAGVILYYVVVYDIARIILVIGILDVLISTVFAYYLFALRGHLRRAPAASPRLSEGEA
jgi:hypothetical protein